MRLALLAVLTLCAAPVAAQTPAPAPFDAEGWIADLRQTREAMGAHYANLDWAVNEREAPLGQLFQIGEQRLRAARNDAEAREVGRERGAVGVDRPERGHELRPPRVGAHGTGRADTCEQLSPVCRERSGRRAGIGAVRGRDVR